MWLNEVIVFVITSTIIHTGFYCQKMFIISKLADIGIIFASWVRLRLIRWFPHEPLECHNGICLQGPHDIRWVVFQFLFTEDYLEWDAMIDCLLRSWNSTTTFFSKTYKYFWRFCLLFRFPWGISTLSFFFFGGGHLFYFYIYRALLCIGVDRVGF